MATMRAIARWFNARRRMVAFAVCGWSLLVVIGAGRAPESDQWIRIPDLGNLFAAAVGLLALIGWVVLVYLRPGRKARLGPRPTQSLRALMFLAVTFVLAAIWFEPPQAPGDEATPAQELESTAEQGGVGVTDNQRAGVTDSDIVLLLLVGATVGGVLFWSRRQNAADGSPVEDDHDVVIAEDLGDAIDEAAQHLQIGGAPRMAVLTAYASLERALAKRGQRRDPAETPAEHLTRVLSEVPVLTGPAAGLGRLYELARFSDHPITDEDRVRAADALSRARRSLVTMAGEGR